MFVSQHNPALEAAIAYQGESPLYKELTAKFQLLLDSPKEPTTARLKELELEEIVYKYTGMLCPFKIDKSLDINAWVNPPYIDPNSPLNRYFREFWDNDDLIEYAEKQRKEHGFARQIVQAEMDFMNGRVSGHFSKIESPITITAGLVVMRPTANELAAIVLHEIGHAFTHLEALLIGGMMNLVLDQAWREINNSTDNVQRMRVIDAASKVLGTPEDNRDALAKAESPEAFASIILTSFMREIRSTTGAQKYEMRMSEFSADRFAARHGAGRALVTALDRMDRQGLGFLQKHRVNILAYVIGEVIKVSIAFAGVAATVATGQIAFALPLTMAILGLLGTDDPELKIYDDPGERMTRIRNELVAALKKRDLDSTERKRINEDIEVIDRLRKQITDRRSFYEWLWRQLTPKRREQFNQMRFQQELERLVNNDLFVKASRFNTLA